MPSFGELVADIALLGSQDNEGEPRTIIQNAVRRSYRKILSLVDAETEVREFSLAVTTGIKEWGLPQYVKEVLGMEDASNKKVLLGKSYNNFRKEYPGTTSTGDPDFYYKFGKRGVQKNPTSASTLTAVSTASADTGIIRIIGFDGSSNIVTETLTLTGLTAVTSTKSYTSVERVVKDRTTANLVMTGDVTIATSGGTTLAHIPTWVTSPQYQWIGLHPTPDSSITYTIQAMMYKPDLRNDSDWPDIDEEYHDLILFDACVTVMPIFGKDTLANQNRSLFTERVKQMRRTIDKDFDLSDLVFCDASLGSNILPQRPLISGVDIV